MAFGDLLASDLLKNTFKVHVEEEPAMTINVVESNWSEQGRQTISTDEEVASRTTTVQESLISISTLDETTVVSALTELTRVSDNNINSQEQQQHYLEIIEEYEVYANIEGTKKRKGKRQKRGRCSTCGKKTTYFCSLCPVAPNAIKARYCQAGPCHSDGMTVVNVSRSNSVLY